IGQRHGLGIAMGFPVYVTGIDPENNVVTVGPRQELMKQSLVAGQLNFVKHASVEDEQIGDAKIRYNDDGAPCLYSIEGDTLTVSFAEPRAAVTPGQAVVVYDGDDVV